MEELRCSEVKRWSAPAPVFSLALECVPALDATQGQQLESQKSQIWTASIAFWEPGESRPYGTCSAFCPVLEVQWAARHDLLVPLANTSLAPSRLKL